MSLATAPDIPISITVPGPAGSAPLVSSERRITPAWTISQLKGKLEPVTGVPASSQILRTRAIDGSWLILGGETVDEETALVADSRWSAGLRRGGEIEVQDTRPAAARTNFSDTSNVEKYMMPENQYEQLNDSVLAWKKRQRLGRFDPTAKSAAELASERRVKDATVVEMKGIKEGMRCRVGQDDGRRGEVKFVGEIDGLGGEREAGCVWVGVELDEPVGRNDGSVQVETEEGEKTTRRLWEGKQKFGVFARPEKVEVGEQWTVIDDLMDEDMEEV